MAKLDLAAGVPFSFLARLPTLGFIDQILQRQTCSMPKKIREDWWRSFGVTAFWKMPGMPLSFLDGQEECPDRFRFGHYGALFVTYFISFKLMKRSKWCLRSNFGKRMVGRHSLSKVFSFLRAGASVEGGITDGQGLWRIISSVTKHDNQLNIGK